MDFRCQHADEYIFNIAAWGFLFKLDLATESFSDAVAKCKQLDPFYRQPSLDELEFDENAPPWDPHAGHHDEEEEMEEEVLELLEEAAEAEGKTANEEYNDALLTPEIYPDAETEYNIDPHCDLHTMFETEEHKKDFFMALEQACFLKNSCILEPENLKINITLEEGESAA